MRHYIRDMTLDDLPRSTKELSWQKPCKNDSFLLEGGTALDRKRGHISHRTVYYLGLRRKR